MKVILAALLLVPSVLVATPVASASPVASAAPVASASPVAPASPSDPARARPAAKAPAHSFTVTGPGVATYPAFDRGVQRYGITTTDASTGTVKVVATTTDPKGTVRINGRFAPHGKRTVSGLAPNDEVSVIIEDSSGTTAYSAIYLPPEFPTLERTTAQSSELEAGQVLLTLSTFQAGAPSFETAVDRNGVPVLVNEETSAMDFKRQANGVLSSSRASGAGTGRTGHAVVELGDDMAPGQSHETVGLTNTDGHDSILLPDGSAYLLAYEPNPTTHNLDAIIQGLDPSGNETFLWNSADHVDIPAETVLHDDPDYAHVNSIWITADDNLLVSFRHFSAVFKIALRTEGGHQQGEVLWRLGGHKSDFDFVDDPYYGPCAQHSASELPNGDILIFDNGSYGGQFGTFCIDPANPGGPETTRPFTRITQYAIDEAAGTATLVSSFTEDERAALFAGNVERLDNDNRIIGWASSRTVMATEISASGAKLWELRDRNPVQAERLFTYRAHVTPVADLTDPAVRLPTKEGATYDRNQVVRPNFSCTDTGGSGLASCVTTGMKRNRLDTSTPGPNTVTLTAKDGAGNRVTVTRHYSVNEVHQPDAMVRKAGSKRYVGNDVYGSPKRNGVVTHELTKSKGSKVVRVRIGNDGTVRERFSIKGAKGSRQFRVRYVARGKSVTKQVRTGRFRTPAIRPGKHWTMKVKVTRKARARRGDVRRFTIRAMAPGGGPGDTVAIRAKAR